MSEDLIERLRDPSTRCCHAEVFEQAAEALAASRQREAKLRAEIERLWKEQTRSICAALTLRREAQQAQGEAERLRSALVAFADHFGPLEDNSFLNEGARRCFALARAALSETPKENGNG